MKYLGLIIIMGLLVSGCQSGKTVKDTAIIKSAYDVAQKLGTVGHITIQCIKNSDSIEFIEVNPRFGGGAILGIKSGANTPLLLLDLVLGNEVKPMVGEFKENLTMLRYTQDLFLINQEVTDV